MRVMLRLFNTLEVVNQRPAYTNPVSDTQIFYALRYDPPPQVTSEAGSSGFRVIHEEKALDGVCGDDYIEELDDNTVITAASKMSTRSLMTTRTQQSIDDKLRLIRREKGQQVIAKLTSKAEIVERELKVRKDYHLSRHYVPAIISVHHTVQHAAYSEAMAEPGYCITMEGTTIITTIDCQSFFSLSIAFALLTSLSFYRSFSLYTQQVPILLLKI